MRTAAPWVMADKEGTLSGFSIDIARQLAAVESAVTAAKRVLIHDHIDHCLSHDEDSVLTEMKALTKLL